MLPKDVRKVAHAVSNDQAVRDKIPRSIHLVWVGPHLPPTDMIASWEKKHSNGWFFVLWRDHKGWANQDQIDRRYARREYNGCADIMRYEILYKHGGFALDADSTCIKALDEGPESFLDNSCAVAAYEHEGVRPGIIGCGFLGATKGHPFFKACIDEVATQSSDLMAWKAVGPLLMGRVALRMPNQIRVYPSMMFNTPHYSGAPAVGSHPIYATQGFGSTTGYNKLRPLPCTCPECWENCLRPSWG